MAVKMLTLACDSLKASMNKLTPLKFQCYLNLIWHAWANLMTWILF